MSRLFISILCLLALLLADLIWEPTGVQAQERGVQVRLDGIMIPLDVPGEIRDGRTLVPFRPIFEALGAEVSWDGEARTVSATRGRDSLVLTIGSETVQWRRSLIKVDVAPVIADGRTLVPLRFVAQALGLHVRWDAATRTVLLESSPADQQLARGIQLVHEKSCMVCHTIHGAGGQIGPILNGITDRYSDEWLKEWLRDPQAVRSGSRMPNFRLSDDEIDAIIAYFHTLN